ncbi:hypothetical protein SOVF_103610, partial [Spinacia oleracea]
MAFAKYFLIITIISQIGNLSLAANDPSNPAEIQQIGIGGNISQPTNQNYQTNVATLLSDFISESSSQRRLSYFNTSAGTVPDTAYGFYLCEAFIGGEECNSCLRNVAQYLANNQTTIYSDSIVFNSDLRCIVRYSNTSSSFVYRENTTITGRGYGDNLVNFPEYNTTLINTLRETASMPGSGNGDQIIQGFYVMLNGGDVVGTRERISVFGQCVPGITSMNCSDCVSNLFSTFPPAFKGGQILGLNCFVKYNDEPFSSGGYRSFMPSYLHMFMVLLL